MSKLITLLPAAALMTLYVSLVLITASRVSGAVATNETPAMRALVFVLAALLDITGIMIVLGWIGIIYPIPVLLAHAVVAAVAVLALKRKPGIEETRLSRDASVIGVLCIGSLGIATALGLNGRSLESDTVHYHLVNAVQWLQTGTIRGLGYEAPGFFTSTHPGNGELIGTWTMLPTHADQLAYIVPVAFAVLAMLAAMVIAEELGARASVGAIAMLSMLMAPLIFETQVHSLATDLVAASAVLAGVALILRQLRTPDQARWSLLAGAAIGFGMGSKYAATLPAVTLMAAPLVLMPRRRLASAAVIVVVAVLVGGSWYLRNAIYAHDPVFPLPLALAGHMFAAGGSSPAYDNGLSLLSRLVHGDSGAIRTWVFDSLLFLGPTLGMVAAGLLAPIYARRARVRPIVVLVVLAVLWGVVYTATPTTGGIRGVSIDLIGSNLRYATAALLLATAVAAVTLPRRVVWFIAGIALAYDAIKVAAGPGFRHDLAVQPKTMVVALGIGALGAACWLFYVNPAGLRLPTMDAIRHRAQGSAGRLAVAGALVLALWVGCDAALAASGGAAGNEALAAALRRVGPGGVVAVVDVLDVGVTLGPNLDRRVVAVGDDKNGPATPVTDRASFDAQLQKLNPSLVVVANDPTNLASSRPPNWTPPSSWVPVGTEAGGTVYIPCPATPSPGPTPTSPVGPMPAPSPTPPLPAGCK